MKVLLDANFLMLPIQFGIDIYTEIPLIVPDFDFVFTLSIIIEELKIKGFRENNATQFNKQVKTAIDLFHHSSDKIIEIQRIPTQSVDDSILDYIIEEKSRGNKITLATNDKQLRTKLTSNNVHVVYMRSRKRLDYV